jgi:hypothetical protein
MVMASHFGYYGCKFLHLKVVPLVGRVYNQNAKVSPSTLLGLLRSLQLQSF